MVDVEEAVSTAKSHLGKVMPKFVALDPEIMEFELSADKSLWNVTFRARNPKQEGPNSFYPYVDKLVQIQTSNGDLIAIRNPTY